MDTRRVSFSRRRCPAQNPYLVCGIPCSWRATSRALRGDVRDQIRAKWCGLHSARTLPTIAQSVGHNERRRLPTLVVVLVRVAHMCRVIQPEDEDQALYDDVFRDAFGLVWESYRRNYPRRAMFPSRLSSLSRDLVPRVVGMMTSAHHPSRCLRYLKVPTAVDMISRATIPGRVWFRVQRCSWALYGLISVKPSLLHAEGCIEEAA